MPRAGRSDTMIATTTPVTAAESVSNGGAWNTARVNVTASTPTPPTTGPSRRLEDSAPARNDPASNIDTATIRKIPAHNPERTTHDDRASGDRREDDPDGGATQPPRAT